MSTLESVRAKIVARVPEIMELEFGCIVKLNIDDFRGEAYFDKFRSAFWKVDDGKWRLVGDKGWIEMNEILAHPEAFEILGRPIQLHDVLRTISTCDVHYDMFWFIDSDGNIMKQDQDDGAPEALSVIWDLASDLDHQSQELLAFLDRILPV